MKAEILCLAIRDEKTILVSVNPDWVSRLEDVGYEVFYLATTTIDNWIPSGIVIGQFSEVNEVVLENLRLRRQSK